MAAVPAWLADALRDRYLLERELGRGGMATVYLAQDLKHGRQVALKLLRPEVASALGPQRFLREIEIAARLTHPHILTLYDSGAIEQAGRMVLYYAMPYVDGESLRSRLERQQQLPVADALQIGREVADALSYAHQHDVIHRDIKPENILFETGHAVVADFGIAHALDAVGGEKLTETGLALGTPAYMSPEQAAGSSRLDGRSDIYALGCVVYEMLAGTPPFTGPTAQSILARHSIDPVPRLRTVRATVPEFVESAIERALAKVPSDRFGTATEFGEALTHGTIERKAVRHIPRRAAGFLLAALLVALVGVAIFFSRSRAPVELDPNLIAVAPFDVLATDPGLWHEGMVDLLSRKLDGAGPLRTVSPTVVVRRWQGHADRSSAAALGHATGARLAVFGQVVGTGGDSVRLTASLFDVGSDAVVGEEVELRDSGERIDRLADSLTVALLRELGRTRTIGLTRFTSLGSTSLPALKAFLQGEQFFRRRGWDSALTYYRRAVAQDSTFVLALRRVWLAQWYYNEGPDSVALAYARRAGGLNHGLAPRESLLVAADSLWGVLLDLRLRHVDRWNARLRLMAALEEAARRYPGDPEIWFELGEARVHFGSELGYSFRRMLDAFDRAIAADSGFAPAYDTHNIELALSLNDTAAVRRYQVGYLALPVTAQTRPLDTLYPKLMDPRQARSPEVEHTLDTISGDALQGYVDLFTRWPDSAEIAVRLGRLLTDRKRSGRIPTDSLRARASFLLALAYRGHLREAYAIAGTEQRFLLPELALFGTVPRDAAAAALARKLVSPDARAGMDVFAALAWWANLGDTASLHRAVHWRDSPKVGRWSKEVGKEVAEVGLAYLALARRDTAEALRRFAAVPAYDGPFIYFRHAEAELLAARGRYREAAVLLEPDYLDAPVPREVLRVLDRARVAEHLGNRDQARESYGQVIKYWRRADPELQPFVAEARAALERLSGERVSP